MLKRISYLFGVVFVFCFITAAKASAVQYYDLDMTGFATFGSESGLNDPNGPNMSIHALLSSQGDFTIASWELISCQNAYNITSSSNSYHIEHGQWSDGYSTIQFPRVDGYFSGVGIYNDQVALHPLYVVMYDPLQSLSYDNLNEFTIDWIGCDGATFTYDYGEWQYHAPFMTDVTISVHNTVPEPSSFLLFGLGLIGMGFFMRFTYSRWKPGASRSRR